MNSPDLVRVVDARHLHEDDVERLVTEALAWLRSWPTPLRHAYAQRLSAHADVETLVAVSSDGSLLGFCRLRHRRLVRECCLEDLYVEPRSRGAGAGGALVSEAVARARRGGFRLVKASIESSNLPARRLAAGSGFYEMRRNPPGGSIFVVYPLDTS
jgi:GNAT superfamily N-acetyltransferase